MDIHGLTTRISIHVHPFDIPQKLQGVLYQVSILLEQWRLNLVGDLGRENQGNPLVLHDFSGTGGQRQQG